MKLNRHQQILTAFAQQAEGPGWSNSPVRVLIYNGCTGAITEEYIQLEDQTAEMRALYDVSQAAHLAMTAAVNVTVTREESQ